MNQEKVAKLYVVGDDGGGDIGGFRFASKDDYLCQKCGKGFGSMKAVYGHMRVHSKRPKILPQEQPHRPVPKKPSTTMGLKISELPVVSEFDEVEEVAACLMMLSRGARRSYNGENKTVVVNGDDGKRRGFIRADEFEKVNNVKMGWGFKKSKVKKECVNSTGGKYKVHKCSICFKAFASGQTLGGHRRHCFMKSKVIKENLAC
ncbi:PREDICTED: zinc finger protein ZAT3-like [Ipomoea nil]|uniref:zinc finger protein ZAT3-like n=1 Tax=Ipomoea nil TaxID=35883 RepID=UPI000901EF58|nr:PREDICTED: zinc finger protein ZAT3-like [Ipomoea nil]